jgi:hypothetical protein
VAYVKVVDLEDAAAAQTYLSGLEPFNEEIFVSEDSGAIVIQGEYADPFTLRGKEASLRTSAYEAVDFERDAKLNEEWGKSMHEAWGALNARVAEAGHLLTEQKRRLVEKAAGQPAGSTARQLYEQQISFIDRVLFKLAT